jgi:hypothetical protein
MRMEHDAFTRFVEDVRRLAGTWVPEPAVGREIDRVEAFIGVRLPPAHRAILLAANGLHACWGYRRIFGAGDGSQDIGPWNAHETWKFAWPVPLDDFLCIGQSGWGDQYAYRLTELRRGIDTIHRLDYFMMSEAAEPAAPSFGAFLAAFLRHARTPDEKVNEARRQLGELPRDELAVFSPSPLLVGLERASQLKRMAARDAMILAGDLAAQLTNAETETRAVARFDTYLDDRGRPRIQVQWARSPRPAHPVHEPDCELQDPGIADPELPWV